MANNCCYEMLAVSKNKESLDRLVRIMNYKDPEYYLYRVFFVKEYERNTEPPKYLDEFHYIKLVGDVAWSARPWVHDNRDLTIKSKSGAHYSNLREICKALDIGVEVFTEEPGVGFQEHYRVDHNGELTWNECAVWTQGVDENDEIDESLSEGGLEDYLEWSNYDEIYG